MKKSLVLLAAALTLTACQQKVQEEASFEYETPTMGWSSWNTFALNISDSIIMDQANAMAALGLKNAGYKYINIDDGYFGGRDPETGRLLIHPTRFPNGLKGVVDYIHGLGLKAGIYSDAGTNTCGNYWGGDSIADRVGLYGHDQQDCDMFFKELGFDFIKVDFCGATAWQNKYRYAFDPQERYTAISEAMKNTGRKDLRLNVCRWDYPGTWVSDVASSWRISFDINSSWRSVRNIIHQSLYLSAYASPGHYNDMDMLEIGRTLSPEEDKTHFGMWCILSSPLLIGCDMTTLSDETIKLITNPEIIALNQDTLGLQAYVAYTPQDSIYVLVKDVEQRQGLTRAVALYNESDEEQVISVDYSQLNLAGDIKVRDLFERANVDMDAKTLSATVPAHGLRLYKLSATERLERKVYEAETAFLNKYQELSNPIAAGTPYYEDDATCSGRQKVTNLGRNPNNDLRWNDVFSKDGGKYKITIHIVPTPDAIQPKWAMFPDGYQFFLTVNNQVGHAMSYSADQTEQSVEVTLAPGRNVIRLYEDRCTLPGIDYMEVEKL